VENLYELSLDGAEYTSMCGGNQGGDNETCVEVARIPGAVDAFALRDSKDGGAGMVLRFTGDELRAFFTDGPGVVSA
jgi:hypothetical protein